MKKTTLSIMLILVSIFTYATTLVVTNGNDAGPGSLRDQVAAAAAGDTIVFDASLKGFGVTLTSGHITITKSLTIIGPRYDSLSISGNYNSRIFDISGADVSIKGVRITSGRQTDVSDNNGGAIRHQTSGNLTLNNVYFYNNIATNSNGSQGGAIAYYVSGGIFKADSTFFMDNEADNYGGVISLNSIPASASFNYCVFDGNNTIGPRGVIFSNAKYFSMSNSTFINNTAGNTIFGFSNPDSVVFINTTIAGNIEGSPYALMTIGKGMLKLINCTVKDNNGPINIFPDDDPVTFITQNTIYDNAGDNFIEEIRNAANILTSLGGNISNDATMNGFLNTTNDRNEVAPTLGPLQKNGGLWKSHSLDCNSLAYSNGVATGAPMLDQRGKPRYKAPDAGSYEAQPSVGTDLQVACRSFKWINGVTYTASNNVAKDTIAGSGGCDSVVTLNLTINNVSSVTTTVTDSLTITADNANGAYQWLDCNNGMSPIADSTNQSINPQGSGNYAVEITENGCKDTSDCVNFIRSSIVENTFSDKFTVYPNPTAGNFALMFDNVQEELTIQLVTVSGQVLESKVVRNTNRIDMELTQPTGVYLLKLADNKGNVAVLRLIKQ